MFQIDCSFIRWGLDDDSFSEMVTVAKTLTGKKQWQEFS